MSASVDSAPSLTTSAEMARAGPAGLEPGERDVVAGRYRLLKFIAEGGMGAVYVAEHILSHKKMALKVVHPYLCKGRQGVERFKREVSAAAAIDHPGIVQVFDAGVDDDGGFFMAMELLEGESIGDRLRREWPGMATAVGWVEDMLEPLAKAHAKGFIHRDLKPDNVFLAIDDEGRERVKILDFGLAREVDKGGPTRTGITFGTPEYMSPEQAMSARKVRAPGDVWSVGVMLYELLSGVHPFTGETPNAIMANAIKEPLPPLSSVAPHVPESLAYVIERTLEKEPDQRPQNAGEMLDSLRSVTRTLELAATVPAAPQVPPRWGSEVDDGPAASADFPIDSRRHLELGVETQHALAEPAPSVAWQPPSNRKLLMGLFIAAIPLTAILGFSVYWLWSGPSELEPASSVGAADAVIEAPEAPALAPEEPTPEHLAPPQPVERVAPAEERVARAEAPAPAPQPASVATNEPAPVPEAAPAPAPVPQDETGSTAASAPSRRGRARAERGPPPIDEARVCLSRGDQSCALAALQGRARTPAGLETLVSLQRNSGRTSQALDTAQRYVRRWPNRSHSEEYRAFLRQYGRL